MRILVSMLLLAHAVVLCGAEDSGPRFRLLVLSEEFFSEGATFADIDADGNPDVVSGPFWYAGPDFQVRTAYMPSRPCAISGYSDHFFSFTADLDSDGDQDILVVPIPGRPVHWFSNPGQRDGA
ncbi:MAG: VCBS repeat-containing protein, partial [Planctomycetaceae bacterium]